MCDICSERTGETGQRSPVGTMKAVTDVTRACGFRSKNGKFFSGKELSDERGSPGIPQESRIGSKPPYRRRYNAVRRVHGEITQTIFG